MVTLQSYGIALPHFRVESSILDPVRGGKGGKRAIVFPDEDPVTLAFSAVSMCLDNFVEADSGAPDAKAVGENIDAVLFATTTPVFRNRYHASFLAELLDLRTGILALDLTASPRAGSDALLLAQRLLASTQYRKVLVVAADVFFPPIGDEMAKSNRTGHAGCALLLGEDDGLAAVESANSYSSFIAEEFVYKGNPVQVDSRFGRDAGFKANIRHALDDFLNSSSVQPQEFDAVILNALYARSAVGDFAKRGFNADTQFFKDVMAPQTGVTGAAHALLLLIASLEKGAERILLLDYHNGANVFQIKRTGAIAAANETLTKRLADGEMLTTYQEYLALRKAGNFNSRAQGKLEMFSSDMMLEREKESILHLKGFECGKCGSVFFLKAQRCKQCNCETFTRKKLSRRGRIFSFTREHYFPSTFSPVTMAVVDLEGGGRLTIQVTDEIGRGQTSDDLMGAKVKLVLRKMMENDAKPNYFWKCKIEK